MDVYLSNFFLFSSLPGVLIVDLKPIVGSVIIAPRSRTNVEADCVLAAECHLVKDFVAWETL